MRIILIWADFPSGGVRWTRSGDFMVRWSSAANENRSHLPFRCPRGARPSSRAQQRVEPCQKLEPPVGFVVEINSLPTASRNDALF